jgi:serine/threonine protein kinase
VDRIVLGVGSYGTVYDVKYALNGKRYAVKLFSRKGSDETENELRQVNFLQDHPHINCLHYYFAWTDKKFDEFGIVTELCAMGSLKSILDSRCLKEKDIWNFFLDTLKGLEHIHSHSLRHLDIKPENLFVTNSGRVRIGDFGVASPIGCSHEYGRGSKPYAAPEIRSDKPLTDVGTAADIYSLGVILYEMVTDYDVLQEARVWPEPPPERQ